MAEENILNNLVRIGTVSATDYGTGKVRVIYKDKGNTSGWLKVLQHRNAAVLVAENEDPKPDLDTGELPTVEPVPKHVHPAVLGTWMPAINETVVVLYLPVFNGDGFVLGGI